MLAGIVNLPNAHPELLLTLLIFCVYFLWDILTKLISSKTIDGKKKLRFRVVAFSERALITVLCILMSEIAIAFMFDAGTKLGVAIVDLHLLMIFVLFRGFKEKPTHKNFYSLKILLSRVLPIFFLVASYIIYFFVEYRGL